MNVTCPNCATIYRVDPAKVPEAGVRARCAVCNAVFPVRREMEPARAEPVRTEPPRAEPVKTEPPRVEPAKSEPPRAEPVKPVQPAPAPAPPVPAPTAAAPAGAPPRPAAPRPASPFSRPPADAPARSAAPSSMPAPAAPAKPSAPAAPAPAAPKPAAPSSAAPTPPAARPAAVAGTRPANPFLSQDPALKARRLARALISDMVVYHPGKRQEGLRDGNLKDLFEEEIKKSWEEYAEQVGREVAESTAYFREALNEILAGGRQLF